MLIQIAHNAVNARLMTADRQIKLAVSELLSYEVEGAEHSDAFKARGWNGRSSFFEFRTGAFPAGFVHLVYQHLKQTGHTVQVARPALPAPLGPEMPVVDAFAPDERYEFQPETMRRLLRHGTMIARVATGGGKSRIAKLCTARIKRPTLFLTTRSVLMYQMRDAFQEMNLTPGVLGDGEWTPKPVSVGMVQTLVARLTLPDPDEVSAERYRAAVVARDKTIKLLSLFEFVIGEEAHEAGGNSYYQILRHCTRAYYRLALTATPFMKDDAESNMRLMACFGPIGIQISEKQLIDSGILATPYFKRIRQPEPPLGVRRSSAWQRAYDLGILKNEWRNKQIAVEAIRATKYGLPVMILVQRKDHGKALRDLIASAGVKVEYIFGETSQDQRKSALNRLKSGETEVLIGSTILDVGVDVPAVGMVILAGGGKAEVALRQRIGRGLRAKKSLPNFCLIVDFVDDFNSYLRDHARTRFAIVDSTPGFAERVLLPGRDFDFAGLGFVRR